MVNLAALVQMQFLLLTQARHSMSEELGFLVAKNKREGLQGEGDEVGMHASALVPPLLESWFNARPHSRDSSSLNISCGPSHIF